MEKPNKNDLIEDYKLGIAKLKKCAMENGLNEYLALVSCTWIKDLSMLLSTLGACQCFWDNVINQKSVSRIKKCKIVYDLFHSSDKCLFYWDKTEQGYGFWSHIKKSINKTANDFSRLDELNNALEKHLENYG